MAAAADTGTGEPKWIALPQLGAHGSVHKCEEIRQGLTDFGEAVGRLTERRNTVR